MGKRQQEGEQTTPNPPRGSPATPRASPQALLRHVIAFSRSDWERTPREDARVRHVVYNVLLKQNGPEEIINGFIQGRAGLCARGGTAAVKGWQQVIL